MPGGEPLRSNASHCGETIGCQPGVADPLGIRMPCSPMGRVAGTGRLGMSKAGEDVWRVRMGDWDEWLHRIKGALGVALETFSAFAPGSTQGECTGSDTFVRPGWGSALWRRYTDSVVRWGTRPAAAALGLGAAPSDEERPSRLGSAGDLQHGAGLLHVPVANFH